MTRKLKKALKVIRDECRKHRNCRECPLCKPGIVFINGILACSIGGLIPEGYDIEAWEKESDND